MIRVIAGNCLVVVLFTEPNSAVRVQFLSPGCVIESNALKSKEKIMNLQLSMHTVARSINIAFPRHHQRVIPSSSDVAQWLGNQVFDELRKQLICGRSQT